MIKDMSKRRVSPQIKHERWLKSLEGKKSIFEHGLDRRDDEERWIETQELFGDTAPPGERISRIEWETIGKQSGYSPTPHSDVSLEIMEEYIKNRRKRKPSPRKSRFDKVLGRRDPFTGQRTVYSTVEQSPQKIRSPKKPKKPKKRAVLMQVAQKPNAIDCNALRKQLQEHCGAPTAVPFGGPVKLQKGLQTFKDSIDSIEQRFKDQTEEDIHDEGEDMESLTDMLELLEELSSQKVTDLKKTLKRMGLKTSGKKRELVDRIIEHEMMKRHAEGAEGVVKGGAAATYKYCSKLAMEGSMHPDKWLKHCSAYCRRDGNSVHMRRICGPRGHSPKRKRQRSRRFRRSRSPETGKNLFGGTRSGLRPRRKHISYREDDNESTSSDSEFEPILRNSRRRIIDDDDDDGLTLSDLRRRFNLLDDGNDDSAVSQLIQLEAPTGSVSQDCGNLMPVIDDYINAMNARMVQDRICSRCEAKANVLRKREEDLSEKVRIEHSSIGRSVAAVDTGDDDDGADASPLMSR
jgi:hypothetical protein